jgi:hypothetical protein
MDLAVIPSVVRVVMNDLKKVTRLEVIDRTSTGEGRVFVKYDVDTVLLYQDDGMTLKIIVADRVDPPTKPVILHIYMNTDDDAEIIYKGNKYCQYNDDLVISAQFASRELAIKHTALNLKVIYGGKADKFTQDWLTASMNALSQGKEAESVCGNQEYSMSIEEVP